MTYTGFRNALTVLPFFNILLTNFVLLGFLKGFIGVIPALKVAFECLNPIGLGGGGDSYHGSEIP